MIRAKLAKYLVGSFCKVDDCQSVKEGQLGSILGTLRKTRRQRQRERHQTKGLMSKTMAVHVRYKSSNISLPSSAKQQREMTEVCVAWRT